MGWHYFLGLLLVNLKNGLLGVFGASLDDESGALLVEEVILDNLQ
jgi:hypothetical protein